MGSVILVLDDPTCPPLMSLNGCCVLANGDPCPAVAIVWKGRRDVSLMMPVGAQRCIISCVSVCL
jgi:hypothetical protein